MTQRHPPTAGAEVTIDADPDAVYALITDLPTLASLGDEVTTMQWRKGTSAQPGAVFKGHNRNGGRQWATTCTVTDAAPGAGVRASTCATPGLPISHWRYDIEPVDGGGCRVTEQTWDRRPGWFARPGLTTGVQDRDRSQRRPHQGHPGPAEGEGRKLVRHLSDPKRILAVNPTRRDGFMCWMCDHPGSTIADYLDLLRANMLEHGWGVRLHHRVA